MLRKAVWLVGSVLICAGRAASYPHLWFFLMPVDNTPGCVTHPESGQGGHGDVVVDRTSRFSVTSEAGSQVTRVCPGTSYTIKVAFDDQKRRALLSTSYGTFRSSTPQHMDLTKYWAPMTIEDGPKCPNRIITAKEAAELSDMFTVPCGASGPLRIRVTSSRNSSSNLETLKASLPCDLSCTAPKCVDHTNNSSTSGADTNAPATNKASRMTTKPQKTPSPAAEMETTLTIHLQEDNRSKAIMLAHGVLMCAVFAVFQPLTLLLVQLRQDKLKTCCRHEHGWLVTWMSCQGLAVVSMVVSFALAWTAATSRHQSHDEVSSNNSSSSVGIHSKAHQVAGCISFAMMMCQALSFLYQPTQGGSNSCSRCWASLQRLRNIWMYACTVIGIAVMYQGIYLHVNKISNSKPDTSSINDSAEYATWLVPVSFCIFIFILTHAAVMQKNTKVLHSPAAVLNNTSPGMSPALPASSSSWVTGSSLDSECAVEINARGSKPMSAVNHNVCTEISCLERIEPRHISAQVLSSSLTGVPDGGVSFRVYVNEASE